MNKLIILLILFVASLSSAEYITYGHFKSTSSPDFDLLIKQPTYIDWNNYASYYPIHNIRGTIVDGTYYNIGEYSIPEPATVALMLSGIIAIRRKHV